MDVSVANHERSSPDLRVKQSRRKQALVSQLACDYAATCPVKTAIRLKPVQREDLLR